MDTAKLRAALVVTAFLLTTTAGANDYRYALGIKGGAGTLSGGPSDSASFTLRRELGVAISYRFRQRWSLDIDLSTHRLYNDSTAGSSLTFGGSKDDATSGWRATRIGLLASRRLFSQGGFLNLSLGLGGGLLIWDFVDPDSDTTLKIQGTHSETIDYSATEIFLTVAGGIELPLWRRLSLKGVVRADHLTTAGAEFRAGINSSRPRWLLGSSLALSFSFGQAQPRRQWKSQRSWTSTAVQNTSSAASGDADGDGVPDGADDCLGTLPGVAVDQRGCAIDSDGDGVSDDRDDCPATAARARGTVDIFGCPVDSDFDGLPDYLDKCPFNQVGGQVDATGCPLDSDADGVPDGLDDCPNTLYGVDVDRRGCIDLAVLSKPLVLHIDYAPGSFEVDPVNLEKIKKLARILNFVPEIRLEINGYTDNVGKARANKLLSEKRARRVRDYLVMLEVASDRIKVFGRGESSFVASNQTAQGRARNRRVEIVFYR